MKFWNSLGFRNMEPKWIYELTIAMPGTRQSTTALTAGRNRLAVKLSQKPKRERSTLFSQRIFRFHEIGFPHLKAQMYYVLHPAAGNRDPYSLQSARTWRSSTTLQAS